LAASQSGCHDDSDHLAEKMTLEQIAEAQRRSARFAARQESSESATDQGRGAALAEPQAPRSSGRCFFITEDGYLVTSFHVVDGAARIVIKTEEGTLPAKLVNADKVNDVAVLKVNGGFPALPVAASRAAKLGQTVFTIGFPNPELQGFAPKFTQGAISSLAGAQDDPRELQISVAVQPGNSGGPLVDQYGNVVGVVEAKLADIATLKSTGSLPQNVNYALKSSALSMLLESLPEISSKLKEPYPPKDRKFGDVVKETEGATALVLVY
jgi:S1-C subfamily serine protease